MNDGSIFFFADRLPPLTGGMEMHARYFIEHFRGHLRFPLMITITKDPHEDDICLRERDRFNSPSFIVFNSGRWIEEMLALRVWYPNATFIYRTGGNEILKAPLKRNKIASHRKRQHYWISTLNQSVDVMITNSAYTEERLHRLGISCPFLRLVGGVNTSALIPSQKISRTIPTLFCAARFVPYKNHSLLLSVAQELVQRGHQFRLRLVGEGPLLIDVKEQVAVNNLGTIVEFLGPLDNEAVCQEIASADLYIQLSSDRHTEVPGGEYIHSEGMGRSILEALTAGTFVVAGRSGALPEIVTPDAGLLVELDNPTQIADQIEPLLKDLPKRRPFSDRFCWTKVFEKLEEKMEEYH